MVGPVELAIDAIGTLVDVLEEQHAARRRIEGERRRERRRDLGYVLCIAIQPFDSAPGVIERVLANDATVCGTTNQLAFDKLRNVLMMHYAVRTRAVESIGHSGADVLVKQILEELKKKFGDRLGGPPSGT